MNVAHSRAIHDFVRQLLSSFSQNSPHPSSVCSRSALLAHGRELINAVESQAGELEGETHKKNLIESGERCIRAAVCDDPTMREKILSVEERNLLVGLF